MSTSAKDLRETLTAHCKHERTRTYAETSYWLSQYKDLARRAVQHAEALTAKLQEQAACAEAAEVELAKLREQKPIKYLYRVTDCFGHDVLRDDPKGATILETIQLFAAPVPAPAVPEEWREAAQQLIDAASVMLDAQPFITAETYGGRYIVAMRFESLGKMQDCHAALLALLQSS